jgi:uncharacterized membrane protein
MNMDKKFWVVMLAFSLLLIPQVSASNGVSLSVNTLQHPSDYISTCPDRVLGEIEVIVTNTGSETDGVTLTLDWPEDLGFIKPYVMLASGESKKVDPFWITIPFNLEPGTYYATITAESGMSDESASETITIEVMDCHGVELNVLDDYRKTCSETAEPANYEFTLRNRGTWQETFDLSASVGWIEFSESVVTLGAGESRIIAASLNPPKGTGYTEVVVTARSRDSYAQASGVLKVDPKDCYNANVEIQPVEDDICLGEYAEFNVIITNTGSEDDTFSVETSAEWVVSGQETVDIPVGESRNVEILAAPDVTGVSTFSVTVRSLADDVFVRTVTGAVNSDDCKGVAVIAYPSETEVCRGDEAVFTVTIKNTGALENTFELSVDLGEFESNAITLPGGASADIELIVDTSGIEDVQSIRVTATDGQVSDSSDVRIHTTTCYDAELLVTPEVVYTCSFSDILYTMTVSNTGGMADVYTLSYNGESTVISLNAGDSGQAEYTYPLPEMDEGIYMFTVGLESENGVSLSGSAEINVLPLEDCYGVDIHNGDGAVDVGKVSIVEITVENKGEQADTWAMSFDGPEWAYLEPEEVSLGPGETDTVYLYLSPLFGTEKGSYPVSVYAESSHSSDEVSISANVPSRFVPSEEPEMPENESAGWNESEFVDVVISENATTGDRITGQQILERPAWKTIVVAVIAIVIILILIIRFVFLFRK